MAKILPWVKQQFFDANGDPLSGGKIYSYIAGTATPLTTYADSDGTIPNANPVILDASGETDIYLGNRLYKLIIADSTDIVLKTRDNVDGTSTNDNSTSPWATHAVTDGQSATNLVGETVDSVSYSSAVYDVEITRGTTVFSNIPGGLVLQNLNSTWRLVVGMALAQEPHGVTFTVSQATTIAQLKAALDSGAGNGEIKLSRRLVPA